MLQLKLLKAGIGVKERAEQKSDLNITVTKIDDPYLGSVSP